MKNKDSPVPNLNVRRNDVDERPTGRPSGHRKSIDPVINECKTVHRRLPLWDAGREKPAASIDILRFDSGTYGTAARGTGVRTHPKAPEGCAKLIPGYFDYATKATDFLGKSCQVVPNWILEGLM